MPNFTLLLYFLLRLSWDPKYYILGIWGGMGAHYSNCFSQDIRVLPVFFSVSSLPKLTVNFTTLFMRSLLTAVVAWKSSILTKELIINKIIAKIFFFLSICFKQLQIKLEKETKKKYTTFLMKYQKFTCKTASLFFTSVTKLIQIE